MSVTIFVIGVAPKTKAKSGDTKTAAGLCDIAGRLGMLKNAIAAYNFLLIFLHLFAPSRFLRFRRGIRQVRVQLRLGIVLRISL